MSVKSSRPSVRLSVDHERQVKGNWDRELRETLAIGDGDSSIKNRKNHAIGNQESSIDRES